MEETTKRALRQLKAWLDTRPVARYGLLVVGILMQSNIVKADDVIPFVNLPVSSFILFCGAIVALGQKKQVPVPEVVKVVDEKEKGERK